jgi:hypothetical protein
MYLDQRGLKDTVYLGATYTTNEFHSSDPHTSKSTDRNYGSCCVHLLLTVPIPLVSYNTLESSNQNIVDVTPLRRGLLTLPVLSAFCLYSDFTV